jgi:hypothetical protein
MGMRLHILEWAVIYRTAVFKHRDLLRQSGSSDDEVVALAMGTLLRDELPDLVPLREARSEFAVVLNKVETVEMQKATESYSSWLEKHMSVLQRPASGALVRLKSDGHAVFQRFGVPGRDSCSGNKVGLT